MGKSKKKLKELRIDQKFMRIAITLAKRGKGNVFPNPLVGAVIVKNGRSVAKGYHKKLGWMHAERAAIEKAGKKAEGGTLYVNLEPCSHFGRTPPCVDKIIESGISRVVFAMIDPNPIVNGCGSKKLIEAGIKVENGIFEQEARELNEVYIKTITTKFPFVALKIASTLDGRIATCAGDSRWITGEVSRRNVHKLRRDFDAVLVGAGTVIKDDPQLNVRMVTGKNPLRLVLDSEFKIPLNSKILTNNQDRKTILCVTGRISGQKLEELKKTDAEYWILPEDDSCQVDLKMLLKKAFDSGISSILVEGGSRVFSSFLKLRLADKIFYFISPKILASKDALLPFDISNPEYIKDALTLRGVRQRLFKEDVMISGYLDPVFVKEAN